MPRVHVHDIQRPVAELRGAVPALALDRLHDGLEAVVAHVLVEHPLLLPVALGEPVHAVDPRLPKREADAEAPAHRGRPMRRALEGHGALSAPDPHGPRGGLRAAEGGGGAAGGGGGAECD